MNSDMYKVVSRIISFVILLVLLPILQSCDNDNGNEREDWVDLRYRAEDVYTVDARNPRLIVIQVKSTHPWEVYGEESWYTISPATGGVGETYDVTIQCDENIASNERIGKVYIKSDYWIGKEITITQKGNLLTAVEN